MVGAVTPPPPPPFLPPPLGMSNPVGWLMANIPLHLEWCNRFIPGPGETREQVLETWIKWGLSWDLIQIFVPTLALGSRLGHEQCTVSYGYLFARPVHIQTLADPTTNYFDTLFTFEPDGEVIWIDTIWAPGCYGQVLAWLRSKQTENRTLVAWEHKGRFYMKRIDQLTGKVPRKSEIKDAYFRSA